MPDVPSLDLSQAALQRYLAGMPDATVAEPKPSGLHPGWWGAVIAAQVADALTTNAAIRRGGVEANPAMKGLASHPTALLLSKAGIGAGLAGLAHVMHKKNPKVGKIMAAMSAGVPAVAAVSTSRVR